MTVAILRQQRSRQAQERLLVGEGYSNDNLLFCLPDGRGFHPERFSREFDRKQATYNRLHPLAPLPRLRLHDYADVRVMPMSARTSCSPVVSAPKLSA
jgi:hypothetical protein